MDWSTGKIEFILIELDDSPNFLVALELLERTSEYTFDTTLDKPQLPPFWRDLDQIFSTKIILNPY